MSDSGPEYFATARDVVRPHQGRDHTLEIYSRLPKDHWTANVMEIRYGGDSYVLVDRAVIEGERGKPTRYLFRLRKLEGETVFAGVCDYEPEEVRELYRQKRVKSNAMWVEGLPFVWGLIDEERQRGLGRMYDYEPLHSTAWSLAFTTVIGAVLLVTNAMEYRGWALFGFRDELVYRGTMMLLGLALLVEAVLRWIPYSEGRIRPSGLGRLLGPLADRFLRWERWP